MLSDNGIVHRRAADLFRRAGVAHHLAAGLGVVRGS